MSGRHVVFLVEDHDPTAELVTRRLNALGYDVKRAATTKAARETVSGGGFCVMLLDLELPVDEGGEALEDAGYALMRDTRREFPQVDDEGRHLLQVIVLSGHASQPDARDRVYQAGADDVINKVLETLDNRLMEKIQRALERSGRKDHVDCQRVERQARRATGRAGDAERPPQTCRLAIVGRPIKRRLEVLIDDRSVALRVDEFLTLLRLVHARLQRENEVDLSTGRDDTHSVYQRASRLRSELRQHLAGILDPVRFVGGTRYCLDVSIEVIPPNWDQLAAHSDDGVRSLVKRLVQPS